MLFLSCVIGEEKAERRTKLVDILDRAVPFSCNAQSKCGGWYYLTAKDSGDQDEGSVTVTHLQGLRAARNAGIPLPPETIRKAIKYLNDVTCAGGALATALVVTAFPGPFLKTGSVQDE